MTVFDVFAELFSECAFDFDVAFGACFIDVDFPANATSVGAFACDAVERIVKIRNTEKHVVNLVNSYSPFSSRNGVRDNLRREPLIKTLFNNRSFGSFFRISDMQRVTGFRSCVTFGEANKA